MFDVLDQPASQGRFGELVGVSQAAIHKAKAAGVLRDGGTYRSWLLEYCENLREKASGRENESRLTSARIAESEANAALKTMQLHREAGLLVPVADLEPMLASWAAATRGAVVAAQDRIIEAINSRYGIDVDGAIFDKHLAAALRAAADYPSRAADDADQGGEGTAAAGADQHP